MAYSDTYNAKVYMAQDGDRLVVSSSGRILNEAVFTHAAGTSANNYGIHFISSTHRVALQPPTLGAVVEFICKATTDKKRPNVDASTTVWINSTASKKHAVFVRGSTISALGSSATASFRLIGASTKLWYISAGSVNFSTLNSTGMISIRLTSST